MKTVKWMLLGALLVLVVVLLAAFAVSEEVTTITVVERAETDVVTHTGGNGETGDTVGDILTFANKVYDADNAEEIGTDSGYCFRTVVGAAWECHWIVTLADGQITVDGPFYDTGDSVLAITGGTGAYSTAGGQMTLHWRNETGTEFDFIYELQ